MTASISAPRARNIPPTESPDIQSARAEDRIAFVNVARSANVKARLLMNQKTISSLNLKFLFLLLTKLVPLVALFLSNVTSAERFHQGPWLFYCYFKFLCVYERCRQTIFHAETA